MSSSRHSCYEYFLSEAMQHSNLFRFFCLTFSPFANFISICLPALSLLLLICSLIHVMSCRSFTDLSPFQRMTRMEMSAFFSDGWNGFATSDRRTQKILGFVYICFCHHCTETEFSLVCCLSQISNVKNLQCRE